MHKAEVKYTDYINNNESRVETMYFNLNAWELSELTVQFPGGIGEYMQKALKDDNHEESFKVLKALFVHAYGRRVQDGDRMRFEKRPEWLFSLLPSPEFEAFYLKLTTDTEFAMKFWQGIVTPELLKRAEEIAKAEGKETPAEATVELSIAEQIKALQAKLPANEQ